MLHITPNIIIKEITVTLTLVKLIRLILIVNNNNRAIISIIIIQATIITLSNSQMQIMVQLAAVAVMGYRSQIHLTIQI